MVSSIFQANSRLLTHDEFCLHSFQSVSLFTTRSCMTQLKSAYILIPWAGTQRINLTFMKPRDSLPCSQVLAVGICTKLDDCNLYTYPLPVTFG
jgi:hypothetical protein